MSILPKVIQSLEEPINDPAAICSYLICEAAASRKFKVLISGQGGDELFGGYPVYQGGWVAAQLQAMPPALSSIFRATSGVLPYSAAGRELRVVHRLQRLFLSLKKPWPEPFFTLRSAIRTEEIGDLLTKDLGAAQAPPFARHLEHHSRSLDWDLFHQMMYLDTKTYLPSTNLAYSDKTSMAHSVELRVPFLDQEMLKLAARLPSRFKTSLGESKILLKEVARATLPSAIINRKKTGFGLPLRDWFQRDLTAARDGSAQRNATSKAGPLRAVHSFPLAARASRAQSRS